MAQLQSPSDERVVEVHRELRSLPVGTRRAVGGGIYMRLSADGSCRFEYRLHLPSGERSKTFDTWYEAARLAACVRAVEEIVDRAVASWR